MRKKRREDGASAAKNLLTLVFMYTTTFFKVIPFIYSASLLVSNCNNKKERVIHNLLLFQHQHDILHSDIQRENILIYFCTKNIHASFLCLSGSLKKLDFGSLESRLLYNVPSLKCVHLGTLI